MAKKEIETDQYVNYLFKQACEQGDLSAVKYLSTSKKLETKADISHNFYAPMKIASKMGHLEVMDHILSLSREIKSENLIDALEPLNQNWIHGISNACLTGNLKSLQFLLHYSPDLTTHEQFLSYNLTNACSKGYMDIVKYLLTSDELDIHAVVNFDNNRPLKAACASGQLDVVDYLTSSPELKKHANIYENYGEPLIAACSYRQMDIIEYLIMDKGFELGDETIEMLDDEESGVDKDLRDLIIKMCEVRDFNLELKEKLKDKSESKFVRRNKI